MSDKENDTREWTEQEQRLRKWATGKLRPIYEAYTDAGKTIPAFLFGIKYAYDLKDFEDVELIFMAAQAGLPSPRTRANEIMRGRDLSPYVRLRERTERETKLQEAVEKALQILQVAKE